MNTVVIKAMLMLKLTAWDVETDGTVNHLLSTRDALKRTYMVSFSAPKPLPITAEHSFAAKVHMLCLPMDIYRQAPSALASFYPEGIRERAFHCEAVTIEVLK